VASGALALVLGVACAAQSGQVTPTPITRVAPTPVPSIAVPTPLATRTAVPTATAVPSPTPVPVLPMRISAQLDPPTPRAGSEFVLRLTVTNDGDRAARGVYVATSGPWDRWTILQITPAASFARDAAGWRIIAALEVPPHDSGSIEVHVRADAPSEDQLTFAVREAEVGELR
jgi:hypothetical protein